MIELVQPQHEHSENKAEGLMGLILEALSTSIVNM